MAVGSLRRSFARASRTSFRIAGSNLRMNVSNCLEGEVVARWVLRFMSALGLLTEAAIISPARTLVGRDSPETAQSRLQSLSTNRLSLVAGG
jgi:hypothetical protein